LKKRILAVDDNTDNRYFLQALLEASGYEVIQACDGNEALKVASESPPDLVISDLLMPSMDGYTLLRNWRKDVHLKDVPFLVYTATYTHVDDEKLARSLGADDFLLKPCEPDDLLTHIQQLLSPEPHEHAQPASDPRAQIDQLQRYNQTLIRKLNEKTQQLQETNQALRQDAEARQRLAETQIGILDSLPAQVALIDPEGSILAINRSWKSALSRDPVGRRHMAVGQSYLRFLEGLPTLQHTSGVQQGLSSILRGELPLFSGEFTLGETYLRVLVTPYRPDERLGAVVMHIDITEQRRAEDALRESEERFRQLAENIQEVFWNRDTSERQLLYVSPAYEKVWGRSLQSLLEAPESWLEAVHPHDRPRVVESLQRAQRQPYDLTYRILRPDGEVRWIHERAFPVHDEQGLVYRLVGTSQDITEQKRIETQLLRAQRLQSTAALAAGMASDLHQIMAPIVASLEWLVQHASDEEHRQQLHELEASARRGADLVSQMVHFAQGTTGPPRSFTLGPLLDDLEDFLGDAVLPPLQFEVQHPELDCPLLGDPGQLLRALENLCLNARDALNQGGALRVLVSRQQLQHSLLPPATPHSRTWGGAGLKPGPYLCIEIWDNGSGIPPEQLPQIMMPFFTTRPGGEGLGLGLPSSLAIIQSHGGFLQVHSAPGEGSRFQVYLPLLQESDLVEASAVSLRGRGELLLFVDHDPTSLKVYPSLLEASGYRLVIASNGAEAADLFSRQKQEVALVITDLQLPLLDGPALIRVLRHLEPSVRVVASTSLEIRGSVAAQLPEVSRVLARPYDAQQLLQTIREVLDRTEKQPA